MARARTEPRIDGPRDSCPAVVALRARSPVGAVGCPARPVAGAGRSHDAIARARRWPLPGRRWSWRRAAFRRIMTDMKLYTRKGDKGETSLFGGGRVPKSSPRVHAYG